VQNVSTKTLGHFQALKFNIEERIRQLEVLIRWRDELRDKISGQWTQGDNAPPFEATAPTPEELQEEVEQFKMACRGARI
jgi:hypothetical protein